MSSRVQSLHEKYDLEILVENKIEGRDATAKSALNASSIPLRQFPILDMLKYTWGMF